MGCCGCDNKGSAITAGIFGLVQSTVGLILNAYFINLYSSYLYPFDLYYLDERIFLVFATYNAQSCVFILLVIAIILHGIWFLSSVTLLIGNANNNACCVRQWVVWTSFIIIGDIIMPIILIACTIGTFVDVFVSMSSNLNNPRMKGDQILESFIKWASSTVSIDLLKYYIILLMSFIKLGPITFITNICLNVFTDRRASDICKQHVQAAGTTVTVIQGYPVFPGMPQFGPGVVFSQPGFVNNSSIPQSGTSNFSYSQNTPLQSGVTFTSPTPANNTCPASNGSQNVCNNLTESLVPTKPNNDAFEYRADPDKGHSQPSLV